MNELIKVEHVSVKDYTKGGIIIPAKIEHIKTNEGIKQYLIYGRFN
jgi:hypothetical protein